MKPPSGQLGLFGAASTLPEGLRVAADLVSTREEAPLLARLQELPFKAFEFHGYVGKRRVVSFGWQYDFNHGKLRKADDIPDFLLSLREAAAEFAGLPPSELQHVLLTEYTPGAGIGWHRDAPMFGSRVVGVSLGATCRMRFQRGKGADRLTYSIDLAPRSAYVLSGAARWSWQHSIPAVNELRYSITFRTRR